MSDDYGDGARHRGQHGVPRWLGKAGGSTAGVFSGAKGGFALGSALGGPIGGITGGLVGASVGFVACLKLAERSPDKAVMIFLGGLAMGMVRPDELSRLPAWLRDQLAQLQNNPDVVAAAKSELAEAAAADPRTFAGTIADGMETIHSTDVDVSADDTSAETGPGGGGMHGGYDSGSDGDEGALS